MTVPQTVAQHRKGRTSTEVLDSTRASGSAGPVSLLISSFQRLLSEREAIPSPQVAMTRASSPRADGIVERLRSTLRGSAQVSASHISTVGLDPHAAQRAALEDSVHRAEYQLRNYDFRSHLPSWELSGFPGYASPRVHAPEQVFSMHSPEGIAKAIVALLNVAQKTEREIPAGKGAEETAHVLAQLRREIVGVRLEAVDMMGSEAPELITHETILALWDRASRSFVTHARGREALETLISASKSGAELEGSAAAVHVEHVATALGYGGLGPAYLRARAADISTHLMLLSSDPERGKAFDKGLKAATQGGTPIGEILSWRAFAVEGMKGRFSDRQIAVGYSARGSSTKAIFPSREEAIAFLAKGLSATPVGGLGSPEGALQAAKDKAEALRTNQRSIEHAVEYSPGGSVVNRPLRGRERDDLEIFNNRHDFDLFEAARVVAGCANYEQYKGVVDGALASKPLVGIPDRNNAVAILRFLAQGAGLPPFEAHEITSRGIGAVRDTILSHIQARRTAFFAVQLDGGVVELEPSVASELAVRAALRLGASREHP